MYYNPMPAAATPVRAWLEAAERMICEGALGGLMLHIKDPMALPPSEEAAVDLVDAYLKEHGQQGIATVANTIFPASLERGDGIEGLRTRYLTVYAKRMCRQGGWGRYFERMVRWETRDRGHVDQLAEEAEQRDLDQGGEEADDQHCQHQRPHLFQVMAVEAQHAGWRGDVGAWFEDVDQGFEAAKQHCRRLASIGVDADSNAVSASESQLKAVSATRWPRPAVEPPAAVARCA